MADTPGQSFVKQLFGGLQRGIEELPRAVRQSRLNERQRNVDSFTQFLNVQRVTRAFRDQQLREQRNQQALEQSAGIQDANELIGQIFQAREQEAKPPFIQGALSGPLIERLPGALGRAGATPTASFNIQSRFQPQLQTQDQDVAGAITRFQNGERRAADYFLLSQQGGGLLGKLVPSANALLTNQQPTFEQLTKIVDGEVKRQKSATIGAINRIGLEKFKKLLPTDSRSQPIGIKNVTDAEILFSATGDPQIGDLVDRLNFIGTLEHRENLDIGDLVESFKPDRNIRQLSAPQSVIKEIGDSLAKRGRSGLSEVELDALFKARPDLRKHEEDIRNTFGVAQ